MSAAKLPDNAPRHSGPFMSDATLRDYFAAKALPGLMARNWSHMEGRHAEIMQVWVSTSYALADLMLAERAK